LRDEVVQRVVDVGGQTWRRCVGSQLIDHVLSRTVGAVHMRGFVPEADRRAQASVRLRHHDARYQSDESDNDEDDDKSRASIVSADESSVLSHVCLRCPVTVI
jgi:hypothetical protein